MQVELVRTVTRDGLRLDGALTCLPEPRAPTPDSRPSAALFLHGVASNFYTSSTFEPLFAKLQDLGVSTLSVNTRGHDTVYPASVGNVRRRFGAAYEIVDDCRLDVAAWVESLKNRGHRRVLLIGHSLGAVKAVYSQAHEKLTEVTAVIAVSGPRLSYSAFMNAPESSQFWESIQTAQEMAKSGRGDDLFTGRFPIPQLMTASSYLDKYGPAERYNLLKFAADLPCPALFTYGSKELSGTPFAGMPDALKSLANGKQRTIEVIADADHVYTGVADKLAARVVAWLSGL